MLVFFVALLAFWGKFIFVYMVSLAYILFSSKFALHRMAMVAGRERSGTLLYTFFICRGCKELGAGRYFWMNWTLGGRLAKLL